MRTTTNSTKTADRIASDIGRDLTRVQVALQVLQERRAAAMAADPLAARRLVGHLRDTARACAQAADLIESTGRKAPEDDPAHARTGNLPTFAELLAGAEPGLGKAAQAETTP